MFWLQIKTNHNQNDFPFTVPYFFNSNKCNIFSNKNKLSDNKNIESN